MFNSILLIGVELEKFPSKAKNIFEHLRDTQYNLVGICLSKAT